MLKNTEKEPKEIQSVQRALAILGCFDNRQPELSLAEISEAVQLNKSTVYGILYTLLKYGYIEKNTKTGRYRIGPELIRKGFLAASTTNSTLETAAIRYLKRLVADYAATTYLFSYQNSRLTCLEMLVPPGAAWGTVSTILGKKMAYHAAASGKVVLAHFTAPQLEKHMAQEPLFAFTPKTLTTPQQVLADIEATRKNGYALEKDEVDLGVSAFSVPVYDNEATLVGTISISAQTPYMEKVQGEALADLVHYSRLITEAMSA